MISRDAARERGMTLVETLVALVIFSAVLSGALSFLRSQSRAVSLGHERMNALQNLRFATTVLEQNLRTAGAGVPDQQPFLVYAGPDIVGFNVDYATNVANDVFAVYYDPDAPAGQVTAMTKRQAMTLPLTSFRYPDTSYVNAGGINSPAETVVFFFGADTSTARPDDYVLYRQVNDAAPEVVSRNLLGTAGVPFFQYFWLVAPANAPSRIDSVPASRLPLAHSTPVHLAPADRGVAALVDSVRAVRVTLTATNGLTGPAERRRTIQRLIPLLNAGLASRPTCGDAPLLGTELAASLSALPSGEPVVILSWDQATDEGGGEKDVVRYVLYRRRLADPSWGDPYLSIPAGNPAYSYTDAAVTPGERYVYALAAQDCTPSLSSLATGGPVAIP